MKTEEKTEHKCNREVRIENDEYERDQFKCQSSNPVLQSSPVIMIQSTIQSSD